MYNTRDWHRAVKARNCDSEYHIIKARKLFQKQRTLVNETVEHKFMQDMCVDVFRSAKDVGPTALGIPA